jgi:hypothetical protein
MSFIASSTQWGDQAMARLCEIIVDSNDGMAQQVIENRTDLLDLMSNLELERIDDLGLSLPFLAIYYDQPDILHYLHRRGIDLSKPCDCMGYGTPMFYAVALSRHRLVSILYALGYSIGDPCETYSCQTPIDYAMRRDDPSLITLVKSMNARDAGALEFFGKNVLRTILARRYYRKRRAVLHVQRMGRGFIARRFVVRLREATSMYNSIFSNGTDTMEEDSIREDRSHIST